ncbi:hypothetical protein [Glycomyces tritici]|uniref:PH domain-containing protein n=1 Tax=Glycomyces tritici TaxID=2665176 RepID=A0ABT7YQ21_9ACTN|nr:hypothetical protein [Glycomyces tritici]MDN3240716.1 hypothetical protein [Glycomyces tritici]
MTFNVRVALWFPLLLAGITGTFAVFEIITGITGGDRPDAVSGIIGVLCAALAVAFRNFPLVKVTPDHLVSRTNSGFHGFALGPADQLAFYDDKLFVWRANVGWTEVPVYRSLLRGRDWQEFSTAIHKRWPPNVTGYWHA